MFKTAFVFPGQGSQSLGMLSDFIPQYPIVYRLFAEASEAIGYDIWQLVQNGPVEELKQDRIHPSYNANCRCSYL